MSRSAYLFSLHRMYDEIRVRNERIGTAVQEISKNRLLNTPTDDLCDELEKQNDSTYPRSKRTKHKSPATERLKSMLAATE